MGQAATERADTRYYKLEKLCAWSQVRELNTRLMNGETPGSLASWARSEGFNISTQKLYEYKALLQSALTKQITVENLLGIRTPIRSSIQVLSPACAEAKVKVRNEMEVLDLIIQRGFESLTKNRIITVTDTLKAIEMKNKLTQGSHAGLTEFGLEQVRELEDMKFAAILEVIKRYVPSEHWEEMDQTIADVEHAYYEVHGPEYVKQYEDVSRKR